MLESLNLLRRALWRGFQHGMFGNAKAAAYSSILTVFPFLIVVAWGLAGAHASKSFLSEITDALGVILPPGSRGIALGYLTVKHGRSLREIISASIIMVMAASGVMITWMNGFRQAYGITRNTWGFWHERAVAYFLVLLGLAPMMFSLSLIAFGNQIELWLAFETSKANKIVGFYILVLWKLVRWMIASVTSVTVIMLIYHWGLPRVQPWHRVVPGAILATVLWFPFTLIFGWYVTNYASYNAIYGPLGAGIALLVWLYIISIIMLLGAEYNALACPRDA